MGIRKTLIDQYDTSENRQQVYQRDGGRCVVCGGNFHDIHEIVSRSHWASTEHDMALCFALKNRVCICRYHHGEYQGIAEKIGELLRLLQRRHGYDYSEREFANYL